MGERGGGSKWVIAYASRQLHPAATNETKYSRFKLKMSALKWEATEGALEYLLGSQSEVLTDNPLGHFKSYTFGAMEQQWAVLLVQCEFSVRHVSDKPTEIHRSDAQDPPDATTPKMAAPESAVQTASAVLRGPGLAEEMRSPARSCLSGVA